MSSQPSEGERNPSPQMASRRQGTPGGLHEYPSSTTRQFAAQPSPLTMPPSSQASSEVSRASPQLGGASSHSSPMQPEPVPLPVEVVNCPVTAILAGLVEPLPSDELSPPLPDPSGSRPAVLLELHARAAPSAKIGRTTKGKGTRIKVTPGRGAPRFGRTEPWAKCVRRMWEIQSRRLPKRGKVAVA